MLNSKSKIKSKLLLAITFVLIPVSMVFAESSKPIPELPIVADTPDAIAPFIAVKLQSTPLDRNGCIGKATNAITDAGLKLHHAATYDVYGVLKDSQTKVNIHCVASKKAVIFAVSGHSTDTILSCLVAVQKKFFGKSVPKVLIDGQSHVGKWDATSCQ